MSAKPGKPAYLNKTVEAVLKLTLNKPINAITVKKIRQLYQVESSNLSAIRFYSLALRYLTKIGALELINNGSPKKYGLKDEGKLKTLVRVCKR
jgi:hypothetical protein